MPFGSIEKMKKITNVEPSYLRFYCSVCQPNRNENHNQNGNRKQHDELKHELFQFGAEILSSFSIEEPLSGPIQNEIYVPPDRSHE
jgi:hypothetical protein